MVLSDMRHVNRKELFDIVRREREVTRARLQELTGYSGPFIMNIVNEFIEKKILTLTGKKTSAVGRHPYTMVFNPDVFLSIGIEFAGKYILAGIVNLDGDICYQTRQSIPEDSDNPFEAIPKCIDRLLRTAEANGLHCDAIGIGIPGWVSEDSRQLLVSRKMGIYEPMNITQLLGRMEEKYEQPIYIELGSSVRDVNASVRTGHIGWLEEQLSGQNLLNRFGVDIEADAIPEEVREFIAQTVSPFLANMLNMLDFRQIVVGGRMFDLCGDDLIAKIQGYTDSLTFADVSVKRASTEYSGVVGSALMASNMLCNVFL